MVGLLACVAGGLVNLRRFPPELTHPKARTEVKRTSELGGGEEKERETACMQPLKIIDTPTRQRTGKMSFLIG